MFDFKIQLHTLLYITENRCNWRVLPENTGIVIQIYVRIKCPQKVKQTFWRHFILTLYGSFIFES